MLGGVKHTVGTVGVGVAYPPPGLFSCPGGVSLPVWGVGGEWMVPHHSGPGLGACGEELSSGFGREELGGCQARVGFV